MELDFTNYQGYEVVVKGVDCERIDHTWAFLLHVYLYNNYSHNHKW
jgi:hypothetical protein